MRFQVPQFIEQEAKIAGPLNFKQFVMMVAAGAFVVVLYVIFFKASFLIFLIASISVVTVISALAFVNISGKTLPIVMADFFGFFVSPRIYLWKKKELPPKIIWKKAKESTVKKVEEETSSLKFAERSRLKQISHKVY
jgi:hypothetical protein